MEPQNLNDAKNSNSNPKSSGVNYNNPNLNPEDSVKIDELTNLDTTETFDPETIQNELNDELNGNTKTPKPDSVEFEIPKKPADEATKITESNLVKSQAPAPPKVPAENQPQVSPKNLTEKLPNNQSGQSTITNNYNDPELKNLRTYEDDVKNAIQQDSVSTTKIFMAEEAKREDIKEKNQQTQTQAEPIQRQNKKTKKPLNKKVLVTVLSIILFVAGGSVIYLNLEYLKPYLERINEPRINGEFSIIDSNERIFIDSQGKTKGAIIDDIQNTINSRELGSANDVIEIIITKVSTSEVEGENISNTEKISSDDFFNLINSNAPDYLKRSFNGEMVMGIHRLENSQPFVILQSEDLNQTYAGMLDWENSLGLEIRNIFQKSLREQSGDSPDTPTFNTRDFVDIIIANKDARAIVNSNNEILFFYSIVDNENVVMTTNRDTLVTVLDKINKAKLLN